ncbi:MAG TPA: radical SAM protein [Anaerolineae bacterium]|nr:radical SAM protein [Anaerolineae bacterium]HOR00357.1 radical SAM protein [Anaerolineae bacterium]HPL28229.1 radical SAM protein [Anaerolineae bacterium]
MNENNRAPGDAALAAYYRGLQAAVSLNDGRPHVEPYQAILSLTMRCNSRCAYCESWHSREEGPELAELEAVLANLIELGVRELVLTGGEPLLKRDLLPFLQSAHRLGMFQVLITNGLLLTAPRLEELLAAGVQRVTLSLDSLDPSCYQEHRGVPLDRPRAALQLLAGALRAGHYRGFSVGLNVVVTARSIHDIPEIVGYAADHGMSVQLQALNPYSGEDMSRFTPTPETMGDLRAGIERLMAMKEAGYPINSSREYMSYIPEYLATRKLPIDHQCLFGDVAVILDEHLNLLPCWFLPPVGNLREAPLAGLWSGEGFRRRRQEMHRGRCPGCWLTCNADWQISFVGTR